MAKQLVFCEVDIETELPIRIISSREGWQLDPNIVRQMARKEAVGAIRSQVINRARRGRLILCEYCGEPITEFTGHMHEVVSRGDGGYIGLNNSVFICPRCHLKDEHGDRTFQSSKIKENNGSNSEGIFEDRES